LGADDRGLLTQQQLADELQVSVRTLERWPGTTIPELVDPSQRIDTFPHPGNDKAGVATLQSAVPAAGHRLGPVVGAHRQLYAAGCREVEAIASGAGW
jgi:hypothetical protein